MHCHFKLLFSFFVISPYDNFCILLHSLGIFDMRSQSRLLEIRFIFISALWVMHGRMVSLLHRNDMVLFYLQSPLAFDISFAELSLSIVLCNQHVPRAIISKHSNNNSTAVFITAIFLFMYVVAIETGGHWVKQDSNEWSERWEVKPPYYIKMPTFGTLIIHVLNF